MSPSTMRVGYFSSWEERCGIAAYSRLLVDELRRYVDLDLTPATFRPSPRSVYAAMGAALNGGEVIHVQHSYAFFGGMHPLRSGWDAFAAQLARPVLLTLHELDGRRTGAYHLPTPVETAYKRWFNRRAFLHPAIRHWLVHSSDLREALIGLGAPSDRVTYRPMPVEPPPTAPDPSPLREKLGLAGRKALVILGFLARRKGYEVALEALALLPPEYVLVAAGGEHAADRSGTEGWLRSVAERLGVAERLRITGFLPETELEQAVGLADIVLAPFLEMSSSASVSFALARGASVIASDLRENRDVPGVRLFPAGNSPALAAEILALALAPDDRAALREAAARYAAEHSYARLAEEIVVLYRKLR